MNSKLERKARRKRRRLLKSKKRRQRQQAIMRMAYAAEIALAKSAKYDLVLAQRQLDKAINFADKLGGYGVGALRNFPREGAADLVRKWRDMYPRAAEVLGQVDYAALEERVLSYAIKDAERTARVYEKFSEAPQKDGKAQEARRLPWPYGIVAGTQTRAGGAGVSTK